MADIERDIQNLHTGYLEFEKVAQLSKAPGSLLQGVSTTINVRDADHYKQCLS